MIMFPFPTRVNVETGAERRLHHLEPLNVYSWQTPILTHNGCAVQSRNKLLLSEVTAVSMVICYHSITVSILTDTDGK